MAGELNFHQLYLFYRVAQFGSISRTAAELRISQPSVSAQVREFEERCGVHLLHRRVRGVALTDAGRMVFHHAEQIFSQAGELRSVLQNLRRVQSGRLVVGGSLTAGEYYLPKVAGRFRSEHPGVELSLFLDNSTTVLAKLAEGALDFGFVGTDPVGSDYIAIPCWEDEIVIIAPPNSAECLPATVEMIQSQHFVMREAGSATRQRVEQALARRGLTVKTAMIAGSPEAVKRYVAEGVGLGFASRHSVAAEVAAGRLAIVPIDDWDCRRVFSAIHRKAYRLSPLQQRFIELTRNSESEGACSRDAAPQAPQPSGDLKI